MQCPVFTCSYIISNTNYPSDWKTTISKRPSLNYRPKTEDILPLNSKKSQSVTMHEIFHEQLSVPK